MSDLSQYSDLALTRIATDTVSYGSVTNSLASELLRNRQMIKRLRESVAELQQSLVKQNRLEEALLETGEKLAKRVC